ncbi:DNA primase [Nocardiopsis nanhaiensis]
MTFVAFGALSMAAALPANADTVLHGSAVANIAGESVVLEGTPQGTEGAASDSFDFEPETYLSVNADADTRVDAEGVHSTVTVNNAHAQLTLEDALGIIDSADTELQSSEGDVETFAEDEKVETLDEEELVIDVEFTEASISITQPWDGEYTTEFHPGNITENVNELDLDISTFDFDEAAEFDDVYDEDITWDGAYVALFAGFDAGLLGQIDFHIADASVGTSDLVVEDDDDDKDEDDKDEDDKDDGKDEDGKDDGKDEDGKDDGKDEDDGDDKDGKDHGKDDGDDKGTDDDLAVTGSPIAALVAAGAVIAAGGGAAAYLARRKKNNASDEFDETDEN